MEIVLVALLVAADSDPRPDRTEFGIPVVDDRDTRRLDHFTLHGEIKRVFVGIVAAERYRSESRAEIESSRAFAIESMNMVRAPNRRASHIATKPPAAPVEITTCGFRRKTIHARLMMQSASRTGVSLFASG